jgi:hypothetical protein
VSNANKETRQLLSFAKKVCRELVEMWEWQILTEEQTFVSSGTGTYDFATIIPDGDYDRPLTETEWDRSNQKKIVIVTAQEWQFIKSGVISDTGVYRWARVRGGQLLITPDAAGDTLVLEYISNFYAKAANGDKKATFTLDTDCPRFNENMVELGLKAYIKSEYGLPAEEDFDRYYDSAEKLIAQERPLKVLRPSHSPFKSKFVVNIPDANAGA